MVDVTMKFVVSEASASGEAPGDASVGDVFSGNQQAPVTDISDLTSEFSITGANTINNTDGTASTGGRLLVRWTKLTS